MSVEGKAVVDYFPVPYSCLQYCTTCQVHAVSDLLNKFELFNMLSENCKALDHSVLCVKFSWMSDNMCSDGVDNSMPNHVTSNNEMDGYSVRRKYNFQSIDERFMNNNTWNVAVNELIERLNSRDTSIECLDEVCNRLSSLVYKEKNGFLFWIPYS